MVNLEVSAFSKDEDERFNVFSLVTESKFHLNDKMNVYDR